MFFFNSLVAFLAKPGIVAARKIRVVAADYAPW